MAQKYVGFRKWTSKSGNIGYTLHFLEDIPSGEGCGGSAPVLVYSYGRLSAPSVSADVYANFFANLKLGSVVDLTFNRFGGIIGCSPV